MKRLKIYVAGPITNEDPNVVKQNILSAQKIGEQIFLKGHQPYVPHTHFADWEIDTLEYYDSLIEHGLDMLHTWADALFFISSSKGADIEKKEAEQLGLPIFTSLSDIESVND